MIAKKQYTMTIQFFKYQGTGNDFVMIDDRNEVFPIHNHELIAHLCHRRFGIGADGLIAIRKDADYDFRMIYFNADGHEGSMCGNGGRCAVKFTYDLGIISENTRFIAVDGEHLASVCDEDVFLKMQDVKTIEQHTDYDFMNTGSPHYVTYTADIENEDIYGRGYAIRYSDEWVAKGGTNVNFVQILSEDSIFVRTYERGVEDETYSCGTGVTACAISAHLREGVQSPVGIKVLGGNLRVSFEQTAPQIFENIYLIGPAKRVFIGEINVR
jgi:diaminopimelate epimerase